MHKMVKKAVRLAAMQCMCSWECRIHIICTWLAISGDILAFAFRSSNHADSASLSVLGSRRQHAATNTPLPDFLVISAHRAYSTMCYFAWLCFNTCLLMNYKLSLVCQPSIIFLQPGFAAMWCLLCLCQQDSYHNLMLPSCKLASRAASGLYHVGQSDTWGELPLSSLRSSVAGLFLSSLMASKTSRKQVFKLAD